MSRGSSASVRIILKPPSFFDLQSMLMVEENHAGSTRDVSSDGQMLYMEADRPLVVVGEMVRVTRLGNTVPVT